MPAPTYTYDPTLLSTSELFQVRFTIGDTDVANAKNRFLSDEEIQSIIAAAGLTEGAAICAEAIGAKYARFADQRTGAISVNYSQLSKQFAELAKQIRARGVLGTGGGAPGAYVGGISLADDLTAELDTDRKPNQFDIGMDDNFTAGRQPDRDIRGNV